MGSQSEQWRQYRRRWVSVGSAVAACAVLAACGSSKSNSSSGGSGGSSTAASSGTSTGSSSGGSGVIAKNGAAYQASLKPLTKINVSTPLKSPAPHGKTLITLGTSNPQNVQIQHEFESIGKTYGWNVSAIQYDPANPQAFQQALNTALQKHPDYINESGTPLTPSQLAQVKSAGVKLIPIGVYPIKTQDPVIGDPDSYLNDVTLAKPVANYFISNSQGKGNGLFVRVPAYPILDGFTNTFMNMVKTDCPACKLKVVALTLPQIGNGQENSIVTAALRSDPDAKYVIYDDGSWADGIVSSLNAAGLSGKVQIIGEAPNQDEMAQTRLGKETLWTGFNAPETAMQAFDVMFRDAEGMPIPKADYTQDTQSLTKSTIGNATVFTAPSDALQQYEALWNK